ncbi:hypothetical protein [Reyranella sp.]
MPNEEKKDEEKKPQEPAKGEAPKGPPPDWDNVKSNDPRGRKTR